MYSPLVAQNFEMDLDTKKIESHFLSKKRGISFSKLNCLKITLASPFYFQGAAAIMGERQSEGTGQATQKVQFCPSNISHYVVTIEIIDYLYTHTKNISSR